MRKAINITNGAVEILKPEEYGGVLYLYNDSDTVIFLGFAAEAGTVGYLVSTAASPADPADLTPGKLAFNIGGGVGTDPAKVGSIMIDALDSGSVSRYFELSQIRPGFRMTIAHLDITATFQVTSVTNGTSYFVFGVSYVSSAQWPFDNGLTVTVSIPNKAVTATDGIPLAAGQLVQFIRPNANYLANDAGRLGSSVQAIHAAAGNPNKVLRVQIP